MGIFSRNHLSSQQQRLPNEEIYVLLRGAEPSLIETVTWSLAVSRTDHNTSLARHDQPSKQEIQPKITFLPISSHQKSTDDVTVHRQPPISSYTPAHHLNEFKLSAGGLEVVQHNSMPSLPNSDDDEKSNDILLQILLPQPSSRPHHSSQPLSFRIEQLLQRITSPTSHISFSETSAWLRSALISLQHEKYLSPTTSGFNVEKLIDFARNSLAAFQEQVRGGSRDNFVPQTFDLKTRYVKVVDYAAHSAENERLKAMFGHGNSHEETNLTGKGWGWTRSHERRERVWNDDDEDRDPYGGLM